MSHASDPLVVFACDFEKNAFYDDKSVAAIGHKSLTSGIGLVHATSALWRYLAATPSNPSCILSVGTAVAVSENLHVGDVVVGGACFRIDAPIKDESHIYNNYYQADSRLMRAANYGLNLEGGFEVYGGNCMSADSFLPNEGSRSRALSMFNEKYFKLAYPYLDETSNGIYICGDMEAAAVATAAERYTIPFVAVKGISDTGGNNAEETYERNKGRAAHDAAAVAKGILERWTA